MESAGGAKRLAGVSEDKLHKPCRMRYWQAAVEGLRALKEKKLPFWGSFPLSTKTLKPINYE